MSNLPKFIALLKEGMPINSALDQTGLNKSFFVEWLKNNQDEYKAIRKIRSHLLYEEILKLSLSAPVAEKAASVKVAIDGLKYVISMDNPEDYSLKSSLTDANGAGTILIATGIQRKGDPDYGQNEEDAEEIE